MFTLYPKLTAKELALCKKYVYVWRVFSLSLTQSDSHGCNLFTFWLITQEYTFPLIFFRDTKYMFWFLEYFFIPIFFVEFRLCKLKFYFCFNLHIISVCPFFSLYIYLYDTFLFWCLYCCLFVSFLICQVLCSYRQFVLMIDTFRVIGSV